MTPEIVMTVGEKALQITVMLSAPLLLTSLGIGLLVAMFQAATQINEMTLSFVPKLLTTVIVLAVGGPWMLHVIIDFTRELFTLIPEFIT